MTIAGRLVLAMAALLALASLAGLAWYSQRATLEARAALAERIAQHQQLVQRTLTGALRSGDRAALNAELDALQTQPDLLRLRLLAADGSPQVTREMTREMTRERRGADPAAEQLSLTQTLQHDGQVLGEVRADYGTDRADAAARSQLRPLVAFAVGLVLLAGLGALLVATSLARPIERMTRAATATASGDDSPKAAPGGPAEMVALGASLERLGGIVREQKAALAEQTRELGALAAEGQRLRTERDRLLDLIESTTDIVGISNANLQVEFLNRAGRAMTWVGDRPVESIAIAMLHPEWAGRLIQEQGLPTALRVGTWSGETAILDAQGREVPVSQVIACHRDAEGRVTHLSTIIRDISERKTANEALRRSEERLAYAVQASNTGIYDHDLASDVMYASPELRAIFGWSADQPVTVADTAAALVIDDRERFAAEVERTHDPAGPGRFDIEYRIRRGDGAVRWLRSRAQTLFTGSGAGRRAVRTVGGVVDITERHEAEEALRRSEGRLMRAVRASNTGIFEHDHVTDQIYWSPEYRAMRGWSPDEPIAIADVIESTLAEDRDRLAAAIRQAHDPAGDGRYDIEYRFWHRNGTLRWLKSSSQTIFAGEGAERRLLRTVGAVIDITERREAEEALRRSELDFRSLFETMNQGVVTQDRSGAIVDANPAAQQILGLSLEQMKGLTSADPRWRAVLPDGRYLPGDEHPAIVSLRTGRAVNDVMIGVLRPDDRERRWILVSAIPRIRPGETEAHEVTATFSDVTELKRAGEQIERLNAELEQRVRDRTAQLEASVRELESFSYSVSHDLRAPLRGIDGFSQALLEEFGSRLDETGRGYLQRVRANTQRMGHLIDDLLKLSRVTRAPLTPHRVELGMLARHTLRQLAEEHPGHSPQTVVQPGPMVRVDPGLIKVALENLLGNAWKYSSRRSDACIEFGHLLRDGETVFFVRDNGVGFDMKYAAKLFGAFQRLHSQSEFEGTGIGLATVERIVSRHGGRVWADAEVGQGATFYFTVGQLADVATATPASASASGGGGGEVGA